MRRLTILSIVVFSLASVSGLFAQRGKGMGPRGHGFAFNAKGQCNAVLDLTEAQDQQIAEMRLDLNKTMIPLRNKKQTLRSEYRLMIIDEKVSDSKLKTHLSKISAVEEEMALNRAKHQRNVRSILTDEQKVKFDQFVLAKKGRGRAGKAGRGRGMGRGFDRPGCGPVQSEK